MKRFSDIIIAFLLTALFSLPIMVIAMAIMISSKGSILYWSPRVGVDNKIFKMPKFRTMYQDTPAVATHLLQNPGLYITTVGSFLRRYSLDELPQLWCVLKGDMSFVGPRPALFNQDDLVALRTSKGVHKMVPGITGWAQINGRDELPIPVKVDYDEYYLQNRSFMFDIGILLKTAVKAIKSDGVTH